MKTKSDNTGDQANWFVGASYGGTDDQMPRFGRTAMRTGTFKSSYTRKHLLFDSRGQAHVYFVAETKGSVSSMELREIEKSKIECARKFFSRITSEQVKYEVMDSYGKLMELVS